MRVGTALENWRAAEKSLSAIDVRIELLSGREDLSPEEACTLAALGRAREAASRLADKCWTLYLADTKQQFGGS